MYGTREKTLVLWSERGDWQKSSADFPENAYGSFSTVIVCDSGSAGFFNGDKPDFDSGEWENLCAWMQEQENTRRAEGELRGFYIRKFDNGTTGFWGYTGGDFDLAVNMALLNDGSNRVAAIEIQFPNI